MKRTKLLNFLNEISLINPTDAFSIGSLIAKSGIIGTDIILWDGNTLALYMSLSRPGEGDAIWKDVFETITLLKNLEKEGLLLLIPNPNNEKWAYGIGCLYFDKGSISSSYKIGDVIVFHADKNPYILKNNQRLLPVAINTGIQDKVWEILNYTIFPCSSFYDFKERGYLTSTEYSLKLNRNSYRAALIACIIAILSCGISPIISNCWVKTTINDSQYAGLIHANDSIVCKLVDEVSSLRDSITHLVKGDSVVTDIPSVNPSIQKSDVQREKQK